MVKLRFLSFTLTISLRRSLTESLEKLSSKMRSLSFLSLEYSCINFERCCRGWIRLMNQHMARSNPVRPVSTNHSIRLMAREASLSEGRVAWDLHVGLQRWTHRRSPGTYILGQSEEYLGRRSTTAASSCKTRGRRCRGTASQAGS